MQSSMHNRHDGSVPLLFSVSAFNGKSVASLAVFAMLVAALVVNQKDHYFTIYSLSIAGLIFFTIFLQLHVSKVRVFADHLVAGGGMYKVRIPLAQIDADGASILSASDKKSPGWRLNGIGIPGYCQGWFSGPRRKKVFAVLTSRRNIVYVPTSAGFDLMLTLDDPESFLRALGKD